MPSKKHQKHSANRNPAVWRRGNTSQINRRHPWRQKCPTRKIRYPTRDNAQLAALMTGRAEPYRCPECDGWHVTTTSGSR